jgi:hypothetical protein
MSDLSLLSDQFDKAFPRALSQPAEMFLHGGGCVECSMMKAEVEGWHDRPPSRRDLSHLATMQRHLSSEGWLWFVSNFLRSVIGEEELANRLEIEHLVYFLSPKNEEDATSLQATKHLTDEQLKVLIGFLSRLLANDFWSTYAGPDIEAAINALEAVLTER